MKLLYLLTTTQLVSLLKQAKPVLLRDLIEGTCSYHQSWHRQFLVEIWHWKVDITASD